MGKRLGTKVNIIIRLVLIRSDTGIFINIAFLRHIVHAYIYTYASDIIKFYFKNYLQEIFSHTVHTKIQSLNQTFFIH